MRYINFNGNLVPDSDPIIGANNRGFRFGDGLFETFAYKQHRFILLEEHLQRLWEGLSLMQFEIPKLFTHQFLTTQLEKLVAKNNDHPARVRLMVYRSDGGLYDPVNLSPNFVVQSWPLLTATHELNNNGLDLCIYSEARKSCDAFANLKHNNYLPYVMGALYAKANRCNDAVILNQYGLVCDSTIANIFMIKNGRIYTTALHQGCVKGTMRQFLIDALITLKYDVEETEISVEMLLDADEIFLSNAIYNIRWVKSINNHNYLPVTTQKIFYELTKTNPHIFC